MNAIDDFFDEKRATEAGRDCAKHRLDPSAVVDRFLEARLGPATATSPENSLALRTASFRAQRGRAGLFELDDPRAAIGRRDADRPAVPAWALIAIFIGCVALDYFGSYLTAYFGGTPARMRSMIAASFTVGAILLTTATGTLAEYAWAKGMFGRIGAILAGIAYVAVIAAAGASRYAVDDEDVTTLQIIGDALFTLISVGGPAIGAHLALRAWLRGRPAARSEARASRDRRGYERDLDRGHSELSRAERDAHRREERRARMRAAFLLACRIETAALAQSNESLTRTTTEANPERKK